MPKAIKYLLAMFMIGNLAGCGTDTSSSDEGMSSASSMTQGVTITQSGGLDNDAAFSLRITDAPIDDLVRVVVQFTDIKMKLQSGGWINYSFDTPQPIDIQSLQGTTTADLLINLPIEAGDYKEIRFVVDGAAMANFVELSTGGTHPLQIPGGSGAGLKLMQNFTIPSSLQPDFIIDMDLRQSVRSPGNSGNYQLKPVWSLVSLAEVGHIRGTVDPALLMAPSCSDANVDSFNAAYVFTGLNVTADDINQMASNIEPVATTSIGYDSAIGGYLYEAAYLPAGDYTIAFTCNANLEDLDADDNLHFFNTQNVTVLVNNTTFL